MTQEEKQLLLKDLCARLPYGIKCNVPFKQNIKQLIRIECDKIDGNLLLFDRDAENIPCECYLSEVKPYLRPMSSMTDEEDLEFIGIGLLVVNYGTDGNAKHKCKLSIPEIDWLNARHFDYRGLIGMGLALEAPEGMYGEHKNVQI